ncbi:MAG: MBL fold metallo-hydrolase [Actinomycetes bacterium]
MVGQRDRVTVTVLGSCGAFPEPGRACSGLALTFQDDLLVVDLGYGTFSRLATALNGDVARVGGLVVTHAHADHLVDAHALHRARSYHSLALPKIPLLSPEGVLQHLDAVDPDDLRGPSSDTFDWHPLPGTASIGSFNVTGVRTQHYVENVSLRIRVGGRAIAITGDTGPCATLDRIAQSADLLVSDCTDRYQSHPESADADSRRYLMTASEAGSLAHRSSASHLMLTHFWPGNDRGQSLREAVEQFSGRVTLAEEGQSILV